MDDVNTLSTAMKIQSALKAVGNDPMGDDPNTVKGAETDSLITGVQNTWLALFAVGGIASGVCAMLFTVSTLVDVASACLYVLAPLAVYQKIQLRELGGMRQQQNELRQSVNEFAAENDKLSKNVDELQAEVNDLKTVEAELAEIAKKAGAQVDRLVAIVKENGIIQEKIKANLEKNVMQSVMQSCLQADMNQDFSFSKRELRRLEMSLSSIPGVIFHKENFDKLCKEDSDITIEEIMQMFRNLKDPNIPMEDNIFQLEPKEILTKNGSPSKKNEKKGFFG